MLKPELFQAHHNLGNIYRKQGQIDQAVAAYHQAVARAPAFAEARRNLADVLVQLGQFEEAQAAYAAAIALKPDYAKAHYHRAELKTFHPADPDLAASKGWRSSPSGCPRASGCTSISHWPRPTKTWASTLGRSSI